MRCLALQGTEHLLVGFLRVWIYTPPVFVVGVFAAIMITTYALIMTERFHETLVAMGGAVATVIAGRYFEVVYSWVPIVDAYLAWIQGDFPTLKPLLFTSGQVLTEMVDWQTIVIVISLVIIATAASKSGLFEYICVKVVKFSGGDLSKLFVYLCLLSFMLTALIGNDPAFIVISALTLTLTRAIGVDPRPYILGEVFVTNAAGASTLVGSFVNVLVSSRFNLDPKYLLSYVHFVALGAPFAVACSVIAILLVKRAFKDEFVISEESEVKWMKKTMLALDEYSLIEDMTLFRRMSVLLVLTVAGFIIAGSLNIPLYIVAAASAFGFLVLSGVEPEKTLHEVDWGLVVFLVSILIVVEGVHSTGLLESIGKTLGSLTAGNMPATMFLVISVAGILSGIMDNVSVTSALLYVVAPLSLNAMVLDKTVVWALIYGSNSGASMTPIGGIPNLLAFSLLERDGKPVTWKSFIKLGAPLCLISFLLGTGMLYAFTTILGWTSTSPELILTLISEFLTISGLEAGELGLPSWLIMLITLYTHPISP
ncbi:MAG: SLC13 family permease [Candidatus Jordarchaeales archaeon]